VGRDLHIKLGVLKALAGITIKIKKRQGVPGRKGLRWGPPLSLPVVVVVVSWLLSWWCWWGVGGGATAIAVVVVVLVVPHCYCGGGVGRVIVIGWWC
jgi:hypothetical protein